MSVKTETVYCDICKKDAVWFHEDISLCKKHKPIEPEISSEKSLILRTDITDWKDEALRTQTPIHSREDMLELIEKGVHSAKVGRMTIVWREAGIADKGILDVNKLLLQAGAQQAISALARKRKHLIEGKNGEVIQARTLIGRGEGEDSPSYYRYDDKRARTNAENYLKTAIPGAIWNRFLTIYENGGDVKAAGRLLKRTIDEKIAKLV